MKKFITTAVIVCAGAALMLGQTGTVARSQTAPAGQAQTYRAFVNQYCVACHNSRTAQPSSDPVNLEKASLDDVLSSAATWERVLRKLSVRAMPPQGAKHPQEAEYAAFTAETLFPSAPDHSNVEEFDGG